MRLIPAPPGLFDPEPLLPAPGVKKRSPHARASAKGKRVEDLARWLFESKGYLVETAPKMVQWLPQRDTAGKIIEGPRVPRSTRHDLFGIWDLCIVDPVIGRVQFVQVTEPTNLAAHRKKILASEWPSTRSDDLLLSYAGRSLFRVYPGPTYATEGAPLRVPPQPKKGRW